LLGPFVLGGCREGVAPYDPQEPPAERIGRRTFSTGNDLDPAWLPDGEAVVYAADSLLGAPGALGVLMRLPVDEAVAGVLFPSVHSPATGGPRVLAQPAPSPDGDRIAYVHVARVHTPRPLALGGPCLAPEPVLDSAALYIRPAAGDAPVGAPVVGFVIAGRDPRQDSGETGPYIQTVYPFHVLFDEERMFPFRPSWSPDGERIVFSDGTNLLIHDVGGATSVVPNTADGMSPAWSPAGDVIAFTRVERLSSTTYQCTVVGPPGTTQHVRTAFHQTRPVLVLVRPDGSDVREIGEGWDPAFSPDGGTLFFRRDDGIWRMPAGGGSAVFVQGTEGGRAPAVSPDGTLLAFSRRSTAADLDVWIAELSR
jgi:Tol biopolymer transport system component